MIDERLSLFLEGLLEPDAAAEVERALADDPALAARADALRAVLDDDLEDALAVAPPAGLEDLVLLRLEQEGLVEPPAAGLDPAPPPGLLEDTLLRLERERLVEPAPSPARWVGRWSILAAAGVAL